jgi:aspartate kinase
MKIFKFGGASLQNPVAIKQLAKIINEHKEGPLVVVVSAMGKTTQSLEDILQQYLHNQAYESAVNKVYLFHKNIIQALLGDECSQLETELHIWKQQLVQDLTSTHLPEGIETLYSKVVAWGEILSSKIVHRYLNHVGIPFTWLDARKYIKTKFGFINAQLDEVITKDLIQSGLKPLLDQGKLILTQGFIASDQRGATTTLGKEGSDFTGAIFAAALKANSLTIWKDVPGIMSADPKVFKNTIQFTELSYKTMASMSYYGAQVVHPKTIYPLAMQEIPLYIRPFYNNQGIGTVINNKVQESINIPIYILRKDQIFIKVSVGDFIFFEEKHLGMLCEELNKLALRINFLEKSPYYISVCLNSESIKIEDLLALLKIKFNISYQSPVQLLTIIGQVKQADLNLFQEEDILTKQCNINVHQIVYIDKGLDLH